MSGSPVTIQLTTRSTDLKPRLFHAPLSSGAGFSGSCGTDDSRVGRSALSAECTSICATRATRRSTSVSSVGLPAPPAPPGGFSGSRSIVRSSLDIHTRRSSVNLIRRCETPLFSPEAPSGAPHKRCRWWRASSAAVTRSSPYLGSSATQFYRGSMMGQHQRKRWCVQARHESICSHGIASTAFGRAAGFSHGMTRSSTASSSAARWDAAIPLS